MISPKSNDILPHSLKEGEITVTSINAAQLAKALKNKRLKGEVKISGYYETAQNKIYQSKSVEFNIDDWKNVPLPPYSYP